jgi:hypothetical protein
MALKQQIVNYVPMATKRRFRLLELGHPQGLASCLSRTLPVQVIDVNKRLGEGEILPHETYISIFIYSAFLS